MSSTIITTIELTGTDKALGSQVLCIKEPFTFFIHREDSEPESVASRNRLAPTQPLSSSTPVQTLPTEFETNCLFRSSLELTNRFMATVVANHCDFASRSEVALEEIQRRQQLGGRQTDGFRRTIGFEKNQRSVREHLT